MFKIIRGIFRLRKLVKSERFQAATPAKREQIIRDAFPGWKVTVQRKSPHKRMR